MPAGYTPICALLDIAQHHGHPWSISLSTTTLLTCGQQPSDPLQAPDPFLRDCPPPGCCHSELVQLILLPLCVILLLLHLHYNLCPVLQNHFSSWLHLLPTNSLSQLHFFSPNVKNTFSIPLSKLLMKILDSSRPRRETENSLTTPSISTTIHLLLISECSFTTSYAPAL